MFETGKEAKKREIEKFQADLSCDLYCKTCDKYITCTRPEKVQMIESIRLERARTAMAKIKHKVVVLAGKGGVGKSMTTAVLGVALAMKGHKVCILDQDFDGPCIHKMLGVVGKPLIMGKKGIIPVEGPLGIKVVSMGNVIKDNEALTWFHQMRRNATEELLCHVEYGDADYLLIDLPPGTSSDSVNIMQYVPDLDGAIVVTIPAKVSQIIAKKATKLCQQADVKVLGVIENMSGYVCPNCGRRYDILQTGGGELLANECKVPFLGKIPLDMRVSESNDSGIPFLVSHPDCESAKATIQIVDKILSAINSGKK